MDLLTDLNLPPDPMVYTFTNVVTGDSSGDPLNPEYVVVTDGSLVINTSDETLAGTTQSLILRISTTGTSVSGSSNFIEVPFDVNF